MTDDFAPQGQSEGTEPSPKTPPPAPRAEPEGTNDGQPGDWRADPLWTLVEYEADYYAGQTPPPTPTARAELAQPDLWASLYAPGGRIVATWYRGPVRPR